MLVAAEYEAKLSYCTTLFRNVQRQKEARAVNTGLPLERAASVVALCGSAPCQRGLSTAFPLLKSDRLSIVLIMALDLGPYFPYSFTITALCWAACLSIPH